MTSESPLETGGARGYLRIATEEAFCPPELIRKTRNECSVCSRVLAGVHPGFNRSVDFRSFRCGL